MLRFVSDVLRRKSYNAQVKSASEGRITVVFSTLNVVDKDRDVTLPGAFGEQVAMFLPAHDWGHPAIGVAKVYEQGNEGIAEIKLYMEMESAREWYESIKGNLDNGVRQEFSYGFTIEDSSRGQMDGEDVQFLKSVRVHEVSPVVVGAGENTRTLAVKSFERLSVADQANTVKASIQAAIQKSAEILGDAPETERMDALKQAIPDIEEIAAAVKEAHEAIQGFLKSAEPAEAPEVKTGKGKQLLVDLLLQGVEVTQ